MDLDILYEQIDAFFAAKNPQGVGPFLEDQLRIARQQADEGAVLVILNELIGHYREMGNGEGVLACCREIPLQIQRMNLEGTMQHATSILNVATGYRAAGFLREALDYYSLVRKLYDHLLAPEDYLYASLFNNMSLLLVDMGDAESASDIAKRALGIITLYDVPGEIATTYTNLAAAQVQCGEYEEAMENLEKAIRIFTTQERADYHLGGAYSALAEIYYRQGNLVKAIVTYEKALAAVEESMGKGAAYRITLQNLEVVRDELHKKQLKEMEQNLPEETGEQYLEPVSEMGISGLLLAKEFYESFVAPMIREQFPIYEGVIAAGLVGEGSECFGFDDEISKDHDFGPGCCLWLPDTVYEEIGEKLQAAYDKLPKTMHGITRTSTKKARKRVGVFKISDFYESLLGIPRCPVSENEWLFIEEYQFAAATNGQVFRDDLGEFSGIRKELLKYYPEPVRLKKLAREAALVAQSGQYNFGRCLQRNELVAASMAIGEFEKHALSMIYYLNRSYAPFYKWLHRGATKLPLLQDATELLAHIPLCNVRDERLPRIIELVVECILKEMQKQELTGSSDTYLDHHTDAILQAIEQKENVDAHAIKKQLIDTLVKLEWEAFDQTQNEGGRASCQDDWNTFSIMRTSQYYTWNCEMLESYIQDFLDAKKRGWNLITEKYGRMEESTAPLSYAQIRNKLPVISPDKQKIIETIVEIQVKWMEEFAARYPKAAGNARSIHTIEDTPYNTSYETYLRGEISTYSDQTLDLYGRFIAKLLEEERNLAEMTMENTAHLYGYKDLDDLEEKL